MPDGGFGRTDHATSSAKRIMVTAVERRAALAWLAAVRPSLGLPADEAGVHLHLRLFAISGGYWARLCELFRVLGMGD